MHVAGPDELPGILLKAQSYISLKMLLSIGHYRKVICNIVEIFLKKQRDAVEATFFLAIHVHLYTECVRNNSTYTIDLF